ncbi:hypothetical protein L1987_12361 [Smallanthus sonchifolius]|uniref:Uncharacterized protein n=1 Tax=Smallanthus sonchifolius TaxID=185202 RepID=A0ACB9JFU6_9ASTR|nr:hypothetical protein L1987_12361 [Smallanthus sonchifolius]
MAAAPPNSVQCFGSKKTTVAVTHCKAGRGLIKFAAVDMRIRVKGGGHTSHIYAIRQSISKALVAYYQKFVDE